MISTNLVGKTLLVLFSIPLVGNMDLNFDTKVVQGLMAGKLHQASGAQDIDTAQLKAAVDTLAMSVDLNAAAQAKISPDEIDQPLMQDAQFKKLMQSLTVMTSQSALE